jgi:hypothetical protein
LISIRRRYLGLGRNGFWRCLQDRQLVSPPGDAP